MEYFDHTYPSPQENLTYDESLLDACEKGEIGNTLRFWEPTSYFVVLGRANQLAEHVCLEAIPHNIPILRRCSGGGTVLQGPGCLNYSLILKIEPPHFTNITNTTRYIMEQHRLALTKLCGHTIEVQGCSDLTLANRKFSGNAQRRKQKALLFHGTFLLNFDLRKIEETLTIPPRMPCYRNGRSHHAFLTNLSLSSAILKEALKTTWEAI